MKKQMGSLFLTAMMVMSMMPITGVAAQDGQDECSGENFTLRIDDTLVTDATLPNYEGVEWNEETGELTLTNAMLNGGISIAKCPNASLDAPDTVKVNLIGTNLIGSDTTSVKRAGLNAYDLGMEITAEAGAKLTMYTSDFSINAALGLEINGGEYFLKPDMNPAIRTTGNPIVINDANITAESSDVAIWNKDSSEEGTISITNSYLNLDANGGIIGKSVELNAVEGVIEGINNGGITANGNITISNSSDLQVTYSGEFRSVAISGKDIEITNSKLTVNAVNSGAIYANQIIDNGQPENNGGKL